MAVSAAMHSEMLHKEILQDVFNWRFEMSFFNCCVYGAVFHGVEVKLATDGKKHAFERMRKRGRPTKFKTAQELLDSFPTVAKVCE